MSRAKITLYGMAKYCADHGESLFARMTLPAAVDRDKLTNNILLQGAEFEALYTDPEYFKDAIKAWSDTYQRSFEKWAEALAIEYEPLENYDRMEEWTDDTDRKSDSTHKGSSTHSSSDSNTNNVSAFNSSGYEPSTQSSTSGNESGSDNASDNESETVKNKRVGRAHGNIGVTTSQDMLKAQLEISEWSIYNKITEMFLEQFCILVYD